MASMTGHASEKSQELFAKGVEFFDAKDYGDALQAFKEAVQEKPDYPEAYYNMGIIYEIQGKYTEAIEAYKEAVKLNPRTGNVLENLAYDYYITGNLHEAKFYVELAEANGRPVNNDLKQLIRVGVPAPLKGDVVVVKGGAVAVPVPAKVPAHIRQQLEAEIAALEKRAEQGDAPAGDLFALGSRYRQIGEIAKAIAVLTGAVATHANNPQINGELSLCYFLDGQKGPFLQYFRRAQELGYTPSLSLHDLYAQTLAKN